MSSIRELVDKHRANGLLIDTNLLVVCLVGRTNKRRIEVFKRTRSYTVQDYELLEDLIAEFRRLVTTPHILTETSNLTDLSGPEMKRLRSFFRNYVDSADETMHISKLVIADPAFAHLGLADTAIALASGTPMLVLTDDLTLWRTLTDRGIDAINFNHLRTFE
jgi:hypothetical protein